MLPTLILTAGLGTRLDPLTRLVAKPAVPLGDRTLIERVLDWVRRQGVEDVVLNLHHRPATLTALVGDGAHLGLGVRYSWEHPVLGSAGGPRHALPLLDGDPLLLVNGDTLSDFDLAPMLEAHRESGADVTVAVVPNTAPDRYSGLALDSTGRVTGFVPRGRAAESWHFIGVQVAARRVFEGLADGIPAETMNGIYRDLVAGGSGQLRGWKAQTSFLDVGTPRDYLAAALALSGRGDDPPVDASRVRGGGLRRTVVWPEARVAADVDLEECIVAGPVRVPAGFQVRQSVLVPASVLKDDDRASVRDGVAIFPLDPYNGARG